METISNLAAAASKAIYGDQTTAHNETAGQEPLSGQQGKGTVDDPFDQGNSANPISTSTHPTSNTISKTSNLPDRTVNSNTDSTFGSSNLESNNPFKSNTENTPAGYSHTHGSDPTGPHDSHLGNKVDPRVDSDQIGNQGNTTGGGLTGNTHSHTHGSDPTGPHDSHLANKADPRVDSDQIGNRGNTTGGGLTGNTHSHTHGSDPTGPHDSHLGNKADPRVDSDQIGSQGNSRSSNPLGSHAESNNPSSIPNNPNNAATGGSVKPHVDTDKTGVIGGHGDPFKTTHNNPTERSSNPGVVGGSDAGLTKQQGAANPNDDPSTGQQKSAVKETKDDAEAFLKTKDPNDHSGEPMKMHAGSGDKSEDATLPKTQAERRESKFGNPGGQEHGKEQSEGTGEQWVKTSGMAADGGDFDATKPGAGREADRLMEAKGIHKTEPGKPSEPLAETSSHGSHGSHGHGEKEKVPLGQKIKDKLHIGSKDK